LSIRAETSFSLKDHLFNEHSVARLADGLAAATKGFQRKRFERSVLEAFPELELKARIDHIVSVLSDFLPAEVPKAFDILEQALPPPLNPALTDDDFGSYIWVVPGEYAARHGCTSRHLKRSLRFLRETTKRFSAESAIRPFLREFPEATLEFVHRCAEDDNYHVRRLASEGTRPLLPWATRVNLPTDHIVTLLDKLHADPTRYVTRSVANNMNDLSKQDPALVIGTLKQWQKAKRQQSAELDWMVRHSLRTLTKRDHAPALSLLGYSTEPKVQLSNLQVPSKIKVGDTLNCRFDLHSLVAQKLLVTLRVFFLKANGKQAPKVFTVTKAEFDSGQRSTLGKKLSFRPMTTRVMYPGAHRIEVVVNGQTQTGQDFQLINSS
jgi:3-methyladenine DNA glycosylase AlkC